jgi:hypothetical protein
MPEPKIFTTEEWGAQPPHGGPFPARLALGIVVHNTENENRDPEDDPAQEKKEAFAIARQIQKDHFARQFADTGQHFTISRGGLIMEGRHGSLAGAKEGKVVQGAHAKSPEAAHDRANRRFFGVELEGDNRHEDLVTPEQFESLVELCSWLSFWGHFDSQNIIPHKNVFSGHTDCPGLFAERVSDLIARVHLRKLEILELHG